MCSSSALLCADVEYIVAANKCIPILVFQLAVVVLLSLLQGNVHVAVQTRQHACISEGRRKHEFSNQKWKGGYTLTIILWSECKVYVRPAIGI